MHARRALLLGHLAISAPVLVLMMAGLAWGRQLAGFGAAWLWWSLAAPRWRLWAVANVRDVRPEVLLARSVANGLLWRRGHWLERTELRGAAYTGALERATLLGGLRRLDESLKAAETEAWDASAIEELRKHVGPAVQALMGPGEITPAGRAALNALGAQGLHHLRMEALPPDPELRRDLEAVLATLPSHGQPAEATAHPAA